MLLTKKIEVIGDSILKGVQVNSENKRYYIHNTADLTHLCNTYALSIENHSRFGHTITAGEAWINQKLRQGMQCDAIVMDYGGNDCDFCWQEISDRPNDLHTPKTPLDVFETTYKRIIHSLRKQNITPIMTTLPPIDPERYFRWFCGDKLNRENIMAWLGNVNTIYRFQESYSRCVEKIARETRTLLVDLRGAFLERRVIDDLLCEDGIHPNSNGQQVILQAMERFAEKRLTPLSVD